MLKIFRMKFKKIITKRLSEKHLIHFIKDLLCAPMEYSFIGFFNQMTFILDADMYKVQKEIYEWLSNPQRKDRFMVETLCTCREYNSLFPKSDSIGIKELRNDPDCPIHGIEELLKDRKNI